MKDTYKKRLVELAKEIIDLNKPIITNNPKSGETQAKYRDLMLWSKVNYLLGYIMALEDFPNNT